jgi:hypothetical protein
MEEELVACAPQRATQSYPCHLWFVETFTRNFGTVILDKELLHRGKKGVRFERRSYMRATMRGDEFYEAFNGRHTLL